MAKELQTADSQDYQFYASVGHSLRFKVKAAHDAHICLTSANNQQATPMWEVFIGGWDNTKSAIRRDRNKPDRAEVATPKILTKSDYRGFWLTWNDNGRLELAREGEGDAFLSYYDPEPFRVAYFGVRTAWGATGKWKIEQQTAPAPVQPAAPAYVPPPANWVHASGGQVPPGAVFGGKDHYCDLYVARAHHQGSLIPGKLCPNNGVFIPFGGAEHGKGEYEVLCNCNCSWVRVQNGGQVPANALAAGRDADGETLYVGRAAHNGTTQLGKVHAKNRICTISYGGQEFSFQDYEVLVQ